MSLIRPVNRAKARLKEETERVTALEQKLKDAQFAHPEAEKAIQDAGVTLRLLEDELTAIPSDKYREQQIEVDKLKAKIFETSEAIAKQSVIRHAALVAIETLPQLIGDAKAAVIRLEEEVKARQEFYEDRLACHFERCRKKGTSDPRLDKKK